jgi:hypothetical protein
MYFMRLFKHGAPKYTSDFFEKAVLVFVDNPKVWNNG